jgi:hypothetical protein
MPRPRQNYPEKSKLGIPYRLRFALNDMGFISRDDIIWFKGKEYPDGDISKVAMPESVKGRFACSYEMVFRFVKTPKMNYYVNERTLESRDRPPKERTEGRDFEWRIHEKCEGKGCDSPRCKDGLIKYSFWHGVDQWFDLDSVRRPLAQSSLQRISQVLDDQHGGPKEAGYIEGHVKPGGSHLKQISGILKNLKASAQQGQGSNPSDVWIIQPEPFKLKHYAVWPSELCERMIKVGCPKEVCPRCGKPRERLTTTEYIENGSRRKRPREGDQDRAQTWRPPIIATKDVTTIGFSDCGCGEGFVPGIVLDPFCGGSGRAARMARKLGRRFIGVDLKEDYLEMSRECYLQDEIEEVKEQMEIGARQETLL